MNIWISFYVFFQIYEIIKAINGTDESNVTQIVNKYGYPMEIHEIVTEDGYILDLHRIPYGRGKYSSSRITRRYPVIITHGLLGSAENFFFMGPGKSLAYMLADNGYDVWLTNTRGSYHSRKHKTLNPDTDGKYWQFSFDELGMYDIPATIDYVLKKTHSNKIHYIGHSQGCSSFFVMCSERPEYNSKVAVMVALAPAAVMRHVKYPLFFMLNPFHHMIQRLGDITGLFEIPPLITRENWPVTIKTLCGKDHLLPNELCNALIFLIVQDKEIDKNTVLLTLSTSRASLKQMLHYSQIIEAGKFQKFDCGPEQNIRKYNSRVPPEYNLRNTKTPVVIFYGETDTIIPKEDIDILTQLLPNVIGTFKVPSKKWNHFDFVWGANIDILLNKKIMDVITKYDNK